MARMRKTIDVDQVLATANRMLAGSKNLDPDFRRGVASLLESVLHQAERYNGFGYLPQEHVPPDELPGIEFRRIVEPDLPGGYRHEVVTCEEYYDTPPFAGEIAFPDATRRCYYTKSIPQARKRRVYNG
jgi:hypothetical protein